MAFTFGFYNSMRGDRKYNADQVGALFDGLLNDGVYASIGEVFSTVPGEGMSVVVKTGRAWFNRTWNENNSHMILTLSESNVLLPRFDAVVLEVDKRDTVRQNRILIVEGTPSANPVHPNLINNAEVGFFQHPLAYVKVDPNVIAIAPDKIQIVVGTAQCPFVTGIIQTATIEALFQQWDYQFNQWWDGIKALLNENTVGQLQLQIDARVKYTDKVDVNNLNQILSNENNRWMTPASTKKAIANQANPLGTSVLPGQQPSGVGSWTQFNGLYVQNMPEGPMKTALKKRYGYLSNFRFYKEWEPITLSSFDYGKTYDSGSGNQAVLIKHYPSSSAKAIVVNANTGAINEVALDFNTQGIAYLGGILGTINANGHFYWNGKDIPLDIPNRPNYIPISVHSIHINPNRVVLDSFAYVGSSEVSTYGVRVINSAGAIEAYINSAIYGFPIIKLGDGNAYCIRGTDKVRLTDLAIVGAASTGVEGVVRSLLRKQNNSGSDYYPNNATTWTPDFEYLYLNGYMIRASDGKKIGCNSFVSDMGEHMRAFRGDEYLTRWPLATIAQVSMGIPNVLAPRIAQFTVPHNYTNLFMPMIFASSAYDSDFTDGTFSSIDQDAIGNASGKTINQNNIYWGESFPTMMAWGSGSYDSKYPTSLNFGVTVMFDDPSKIRVPYDPTGSVFRYA